MWSPVGLPVVSQGPRLEPRSHSSVRNPWRIITRRGRFAESGHQSSRPLSTQELSLKETGTRLADGAGAARAEMSPDNGRRPKWQSAGAVECTRIGASSCTVLAKTLRRVLHLLWYRAKAGGVPSGVPCNGLPSPDRNACCDGADSCRDPGKLFDEAPSAARILACCWDLSPVGLVGLMPRPGAQGRLVRDLLRGEECGAGLPNWRKRRRRRRR